LTDGDENWSARRSILWGFLTLFILVFGFGAWSILTNLSGAIIAPGQIEVSQNRQIVQHPDGGVVERVAVIEGDTVEVGDVLIQLDGTLLRSELAIVENQLFEIIARRARLQAERDGETKVAFPDELLDVATSRPEVAELSEGQSKLFEARRETLGQQTDQLQKRVGQIQSQIGGLAAQSAALVRQLALLSEELVSQQTLLEKGLAQAARVLALQREEARLDGEVGQLKAERAQAEGRITEVEIQILGLQSARREDAITELRDVAYRELELAERRRALVERIARLDIRAPVAGTVLGLQIKTPRSVVRAAEPILYLVPQDRPLVISAQVPTIHIDQVHVGQEVRLLFSSFSSRTTPELHGRVSVVSADALKDEGSQISFYRVEIVMPLSEIGKLGNEVLVPGMPVETFIRTEDRTPLAYLIKPFTDYFNRAFRES
jgi:HlyD family secretion protein